MHDIHAHDPLPNASDSTIFLLTLGFKPPAYQQERITIMIVVTVLRALGQFFASLPGSIAEAQQLRREFYRRHPFMEF